jgi:hypothetical protein
MTKVFAGLLIATFAACTTSASKPIPEGNWDVTLTFTDGNCAGLPATFVINFDITDDAQGGFTLTAKQGLGGTNVSGVMVCDPTLCTLNFSDEGPGTLGSNVDTQTLTATLDLDSSDTVTSRPAPNDGTADLILVGGAQCSQHFDAAGDVVR